MMRLTLTVTGCCLSLLLTQGQGMAQGKPEKPAVKVAVTQLEKPLGPGAGVAGAAESTRLVGLWPRPVPTVTLDLEGGTVGEALAEIAKQAGWSLALSAADEAVEQEITLKLNSRPATEALEVVLDAAGLEARLNGSTLAVKAEPPVRGDASASVELPIGDLRVDLKGVDSKAFDRDHPRRRHHGRGKDDRVVVGGSVKVEAGETVQDAVAVGGSTEILGHVRGDAVAVGGDVVLEPGAVVDGDAVAVGGDVDVPEGATLRGNRVSIGGSLGGLFSGLVKLGTQHSFMPLFAWKILTTLVRAVVLFVLGLLLLAFIPERVQNVREFLVAKPGTSVLGGLGLLFGILPLCLLLAVTVVGIPLVPIAVLLLVAALVIGLTAFSIWLGYRLPLFESRKTPVTALLLGLIICTLVDFIPFFGSALLTFIAFAAAGAVLLSRFGKNRSPAAVGLDSPAT